MESTVCSDNEGIPLNKNTSTKRLKAFLKESRSLSPISDCFKSINKLPQLLLSSTSSNTNITPPPRHSPVKLIQQNKDSNRIQSIIKRNLFPDIKANKNSLPRAPSVNDIEPLFIKAYHPDVVSCRKCNKTSVIFETNHLAEYKI